jgi:hypothetical protein
MVRRAARWLEAAGVKVPRKPGGEPDVVIEIAPEVALSAEDLMGVVSQAPPLPPGEEVYLS